MISSRLFNKITKYNYYCQFHQFHRLLSSKPLRTTPLWNLHNSLNAHTTEFSGWNMPLTYPEGIIQEHLHCRSIITNP